MTPALDSLRSRIARHAKGPRDTTAIPFLTLLRAETPSLPIGALYQPVVCFVAQGAKRLMLGGRHYDYDDAKYLVVSVDLPVVGGVVRASPEKPYLALSLALDPGKLASLLIEMGETGAEAGGTTGLAVASVTEELLDAASRLVGLLDRPDEIPFVAPLVEREIHYRLLAGDRTGLLRQIARAESRLSRIGRAIAFIRGHYAEPIAIEAVAAAARMSPASLHRHFKAVTALSPLQYQKQIRLQEARRMLMARRTDAASVGFAVGYESPSQFSREYARLFGAPPATDAARLRSVGAALDAA